MTSRCGRLQAKLPELGLITALCALTGCGDARHSLGGPSSSSQLSRCDPGAKIDLIDDMEDGNGSLFLNHGRAGVWFSYNDETNQDTGETTKQWPKVGAERFFMDPIQPPRGSSTRGAHTHGAGYANWGAGIGFDLLVQQEYDASKYAGLTFFIRRAAYADASVRLNVTDRNTSPLGGVCDTDHNGCYSDFGYSLEATEDWQEMKIPWSALTQPTWAVQIYPSIVTSALFGIRFQAPPGVAFDFWIDDIAFLCRE